MGWFKSTYAEDKEDLKERVRNRNKVESMINLLERKGYKKPQKIKALLVEAITEQFDEEIAIVDAKLGELIEKLQGLKEVEAFDKIEDLKIEQKISDATVSIDYLKRKKIAMLSQLDVLIP